MLMTLIFLFSCDKILLFVSCSGCTKVEPKTATIEIKIDDAMLIAPWETIVRIYSGNLEDNVLLYTSDGAYSDLKYTVTINRKYTITATYIIKGVAYNAVDSVFPKVGYEKDQCAEPCYFVYDNQVNLRLKYMGS
jgi:hypothetical protein